MPHPNTAAAKLFMLSSNRALDLFENHVTLRAIKGDIDPDHLTKVAHKLLDIAWEAQRKGGCHGDA